MAKPVKSLTTAVNPDPVPIVAKAQKRSVVPPPGKKRKQMAHKKAAVIKGRWDAPEEIGDSSYSGDDDDEEKGESDDDGEKGESDDEEKGEWDDDEDNEGKRRVEDDNNMVPHDSSDNDNSMDRMDRFVRDCEKTEA